MERTLIILKPNVLQRGLVGEIISRFEKRGLVLVGMKLAVISRELAERHYAEHRGKPFFEGLLEFITAGPSVIMVVQGEEAIEMVRRMCGETDPHRAAPGTIRGDFAIRVDRNAIHASDSADSARREIGLFFPDGELLDHRPIFQPWV